MRSPSGGHAMCCRDGKDLAEAVSKFCSTSEALVTDLKQRSLRHAFAMHQSTVPRKKRAFYNLNNLFECETRDAYASNVGRCRAYHLQICQMPNDTST